MFLLLVFSITGKGFAAHAGGEYTRVEIRYGMLEKAVNKKYGEPLAVERFKWTIFQKKKAMYQVGEAFM